MTACLCVRVGVWMCWGVNDLPEAHFTTYQGSASLEHVQVGSSGLLAPDQLPPGVPQAALDMISITEWQSECRGLGCTAGSAGLGREGGAAPPSLAARGNPQGDLWSQWRGAAMLASPRPQGQACWDPYCPGRHCSGLPGSQRLLPGGAGRLTTLIPFPFTVLKLGVLPGWTWEASAYSDSPPHKVLKSPVALAPSDQKLNSNPLPKSPCLHS